jgi:adenylate cyclase
VGRIQVTTEAREFLAGQFEFERRGFVEVKGKGRVETWFLVGRRPGGGTRRARTAGAKSQAPAS